MEAEHLNIPWDGPVANVGVVRNLPVNTSDRSESGGLGGSVMLRLAYSNVWMALGGTGFAILAILITGLPFRWQAILLPFLITYAVYSADKLLGSDDEGDLLNDPVRTAFLARWGRALSWLATVGFLAGLVIASMEGLVVLILYVAPLVVGVLYGIKVLPRGWRFRRLKDITGVKNVVVAVTWGTTTVLIPAYVCGTGVTLLVAAVVVFVTLRMYVNTTYFDLGDLKGDRAEGVQTLPVVLGFRRTRTLLHVMNVIAALYFFGVILVFDLPLAAHVVNAAALYVLAFLAYARDENTDLNYVGDVVADGEPVVVGMLALVGTLLFV